MKIRENEVVVLLGGDPDDEAMASLRTTLEHAGYAVAGMLRDVRDGGVIGDDGQGRAYHLISAAPAADEEDGEAP
jgi:hypothetical protein